MHRYQRVSRSRKLKKDREYDRQKKRKAKSQKSTTDKNKFQA
jgi:hypothetical protein